MGAGKSKMEGVSMTIVFEGESRAFDGNHPIIGTVNVDTNQQIPAYGIHLKLELIDSSKQVDYGDKGQRVPHVWKRRVWEKSVMINCFDGNTCPLGQSSHPFQFDVPADLPQSLYFNERSHEVRMKLRYFFKAQLVPINTELLNNEWGKCQVRDRQRVHISPVRPTVNDPQFNTMVPLQKKVGLIGGKMSNMEITISKNFFLAGEMVYLMVNIDNSLCKDACSLHISHKCKVKMYQNWRKWSCTRNHHKESFHLAGPHEKKQVVLQFQIASKRASCPGTGFFGKHAAEYHQVSTLAPESVFAQTFAVTNFLEFYLSHEGTVFSNDSTKKFHFQLIQHSLVPGVIQPPPPIFLGVNGVPLSMDDPVISAPEGECVIGEVMDVAGENETQKKGKDQAPEEPVVSAAAK